MKSLLVAQSVQLMDAFDQYTVSVTLATIRQDMSNQLADKPSAHFVVHSCHTLTAFAVGAGTNCYPAALQIARLVHLIDCNFERMQLPLYLILSISKINESKSFM